ncbi:C-type mannose receptor 2 isoform X1 [Ictalurus punctatus]|uniref:C-type mannose receptor 2 isoform X1 n=1 Tax=Ictalurus punctatus TaxID=7998 RepID=A0A979FEP7_ICTPU|nr:C-type mannose receptor 2 isoform X1 [Ictalurus punctatus]
MRTNINRHVFSLLFLSGMCSPLHVLIFKLHFQRFLVFLQQNVSLYIHLWFYLWFLQTTGLFGVSALVARDFFYVDMAKTWLEAQSYCRKKHTDLATVDNMSEMQTLINQVDPFYFGDVWIGLTKGAETRWGWSMGDNTIQQYSMLKTMSNTLFINESCGAISQDGYWYSLSCFSLQEFICYDEYNSMIYSISVKLIWREAQAYCRLKYTDLVDIQSAAEQQNVLRLVFTDYVWIGLFSDYWKWSDGATSFFRYWGTGKPLSLFNISNCVVMQMNDYGTWDNSLCDRRLPFVCYEGQLCVLLLLLLLFVKLNVNFMCTWI